MSHKIKQQQEEGETTSRNNNVTQRFIECNKRNKYRGFSVCRIKKKSFIYGEILYFMRSGHLVSAFLKMHKTRCEECH